VHVADVLAHEKQDTIGPMASCEIDRRGCWPVWFRGNDWMPGGNDALESMKAKFFVDDERNVLRRTSAFCGANLKIETAQGGEAALAKIAAGGQ